MYSQSILPTELIFAVFELTSNDRFTLAKLARLNRAFQPIAEQILYRSMTHWLGSYSQELFLDTVLNNKRLASYVHRFGIIDYRIASREWEVRGDSSLWDLIASCVGVMSNLKELIVDLDWNNIPLVKFLPAFAKLDLQAFTWCGKGIKDTRTIVEFLGQNYWKTLQCLKINLDGVNVGSSIDEDWCPGLVRLEGDTTAIRKIMPGRNIQELGWYPEMEMPVGEVDEPLALALQAVGALCVSFLMSFEHLFLDGVFINVQQLRILHAENAQAFIPRLLKHLPSLCELAVDSKSGHWPISQAFSMCPALHCMYIMRPGYPVEEDKHDRDPLNIGVQYYRCLPDPSSTTLDGVLTLKRGSRGQSMNYHIDDEYIKADGSMNFRHYLSFRKPATFRADDYINTLQHGYMISY